MQEVAGERLSPRMPPYDPLNLMTPSEPVREKLGWGGDLLELGFELGLELGIEVVAGFFEVLVNL